MNQTTEKLTFESYLIYDDGTDNRYELERGKLLLMNPPTVRHLLIGGKVAKLSPAATQRLKFFP